jgi:hypothetical protein
MAKQTVAKRTATRQTTAASAQAEQRSRREQLREVAAAKRRRQNILVGAGIAVVIALVVGAVWLNMRAGAPVVGEQSFATQGNVHIAFGSQSPIEYNSTPPTSGPHYENLAGWGSHDEPVQYEHLVHNLEDGGIVVYYQCPEGCPEIVDELTALLAPYWDAGRHVTLVPNDPTWTVGNSLPLHKDMGATIAVTAWQKLLTMDAVDADAIRAFVERYEGIDHHR